MDIADRQPPSDDAVARLDELSSNTIALGLAGRRIGPYLLLSELGRGGMGSVWLAQRSDGQYEAKVAVKMLAAAWHGEEGQARFRHEGTLLARLDHPNIARLLDAGITDLGESYLVLEYVEGERLDHYCHAAGLGLVARIELFLKVLDAVAHAHRNLIIHRDIKPANVLVTAAGQPKLLDFGIGQLVQEDQTWLTRTGHAMLTPECAAPEQLLGDPVTTATDIYALGLLLYVLLTGRHPYGTCTASPAELIQRVTTGAMPLPSSVANTAPQDASPGLREYAEATRTLRRALQGDLDNIVLKAVHPTPDQRYEDVTAFANDLRRFLRHEPVKARASSLMYRCRKFVRRHRTGLAASALVLVALIVAITITLWQMLEAGRQRDEALYQSRSVELISDFLNLSLFSEGGPDRPVLSMAERIERGASLLEKQYGKDPRFAGRMLIQLANRFSSGETAPPMKLMTRAYEMGSQSHDAELMASAQCSMVQTLVSAGLLEQAAPRLADGRRWLGSVRRPELTVRVECLVAESQFEHRRGNSAAAIALLRKSARLIEDAQYVNRPMYASVLSYLTIVHADRRDFAAAIAMSEQAAQVELQAGRGDTSEHVSTLQNIASLLSFVGEIGRSLREREALNQLMRRFTAAQQMPFAYLNNHADLLLRMQRTVDAQRVLAGVVGRVREAGNSSMLLQTLQYRAWAQIQQQDWTAAEQTLAEAQTLVDRDAGSRAVNSLIEVRRAQVALARGDLTQARGRIDQALELSGYRTSQPERSLSRVLMAAAEVALTAQQNADAERFASDALRLSEAVARGADTSADVGESLLLLAKARSRTATVRQRRLLQRAVACLSNGLYAEHPLALEARALLQQLADR